MELELGLALPTNDLTKGFDLNNDNGLIFSKGKLLGLGNKNCVNMKRGVEEAFGKAIEDCRKKSNLLLWSGDQPNEEDDDDKGLKEIDSSTINKSDEEEGGGVVGWPPIKSWRKRLFHEHNIQVGTTNNNDNINNGRRSKYVKVKMEGVPIARKIDLTLYHSYQLLTGSLITMFAKYQRRDKYDSDVRYTLTYKDKEGDWLLAGDVPWHSFIDSVQRLQILRNSG